MGDVRCQMESVAARDSHPMHCVFHWSALMRTRAYPRSRSSVTRLLGLSVILFVASIAEPSGSSAQTGCETYTMTPCISIGSCLELAETTCGSQLPGCAGAGWVACAFANCDPDEVAMVCFIPDVE